MRSLISEVWRCVYVAEGFVYGFPWRAVSGFLLGRRRLRTLRSLCALIRSFAGVRFDFVRGVGVRSTQRPGYVNGAIWTTRFS